MDALERNVFGGFTLNTISGTVDYSLVMLCFFFWLVVQFAIKYSIQAFFYIFCSTLEESQIKIPPPTWKIGPGAFGEWETPVSKATEEQLTAFLEMRKVTPKKDAQGKASMAELRKLALAEAVKYKYECTDFAHRTYNHEVYSNGNKHYTYYIPQHHWNGWRGVWAEMGSYGRGLFSGNLAYSTQHATSGVLAWWFLSTHNPFAYKLCLYLDIGFNMVDLLLMSLSLVLKRDITVYSGFGPIFGAAGIFKLLVIHHFAAVLLELCALLNARTVEHASLIMEMMVALVGTTGLLHFVCIVTYLTPVRESTLLSLVLHVTQLALMVWYRVVFWLYLVWRCTVDAFAVGGVVVGVISLSAFGLFTLFNVDLVHHYYKVSMKLYGQLGRAKKA